MDVSADLSTAGRQLSQGKLLDHEIPLVEVDGCVLPRSFPDECPSSESSLWFEWSTAGVLLQAASAEPHVLVLSGEP